MNRPIFVILIGYIIGIIWGLYLNTSIVSFYAILLLMYIVIKIPYPKKKFKILSIKRYFRYIKLIFKINIILTIIISSFISNFLIKYYNKKYEALYQDGEAIEITAIIISNKEEREYKNRYKIKVTEGKYKNTNLYINVSKNIELEYGDKVQIRGKYNEPEVARNYKGFNYKTYLKTIKIYGTLDIEKIEVIEKRCLFLQIPNDIKLKIKENIEKTYNEEISPIIEGIMLGETKNIESEIREDFSKSNISHILAVSGMHISYIIFAISNSTKKIFGKRKSKIITSIVLMIYMSITGFSVSVVRASISGILMCMSFVVYRRSDTLNNISISALIILLYNPFLLINISFLLTFGGTIGIVCFEKTIEKILKNIKIRNRKIRYLILKKKGRVKEKIKFRNLLHIERKKQKVIEIISVSISAQLAIIPIMAIQFNSIGMGFLLNNLLLSLVIGIIVMGCFLQIVISLFSLEIGVVLAKIIEFPIHILLLISKIQIGNIKVVTPSSCEIILYYIFIIVFFKFYKIYHYKWENTTYSRIKNTISLIKYNIKSRIRRIQIIVVIIIFSIILINRIPGDFKIHFIDVGQGDSTLIMTPEGKNILIDGGGNANYDVGDNTLVPYLLDRKIKYIDYVIISHFDQDHVGRFINCFTRIKCWKSDYCKTSRKFRQL